MQPPYELLTFWRNADENLIVGVPGFPRGKGGGASCEEPSAQTQVVIQRGIDTPTIWGRAGIVRTRLRVSPKGDRAGRRRGRLFCPQDQFTMSQDSVTTKEFHDEILPQEGTESAHFRPMCGPRFCVMKVTEDLRTDAAEQGLCEEA